MLAYDILLAEWNGEINHTGNIETLAGMVELRRRRGSLLHAIMGMTLSATAAGTPRYLITTQTRSHS